MIPDALIVSLFLFGAGIALTRSPMPVWVKYLLGASFAFVGCVYMIDAFGMFNMSEKAFYLRYALIILSSVTIICVAAWVIAGGRVWRKR